MRETEAGARSRARGIASAKWLERALGELRRYARPLVAHVELDSAVSYAPRLDLNPPLAVAQRVVDEVADGLLRPQPVDVEDEAVFGIGLDLAGRIPRT